MIRNFFCPINRCRNTYYGCLMVLSYISLRNIFSITVFPCDTCVIYLTFNYLIHSFRGHQSILIMSNLRIMNIIMHICDRSWYFTRKIADWIIEGSIIFRKIIFYSRICYPIFIIIRHYINIVEF